GEGLPSSLSARELEVGELVAEGLSNPAIARRLYLSRPTVATHVAHILTKLDFSSRAEIAAWIGERRTQHQGARRAQGRPPAGARVTGRGPGFAPAGATMGWSALPPPPRP